MGTVGGANCRKNGRGQWQSISDFFFKITHAQKNKEQYFEWSIFSKVDGDSNGYLLFVKKALCETKRLDIARLYTASPIKQLGTCGSGWEKRQSL